MDQAGSSLFDLVSSTNPNCHQYAWPTDPLPTLPIDPFRFEISER